MKKPIAYTSCLGKSFDFIKHEFVGLLILNYHIKVSFYSVISSPLANCWMIWHDDGYQVVLERISIYEDLLDVKTLHKLVLNLFWDYILSLGKLKDILLSVNNLDATIL